MAPGLKQAEAAVGTMPAGGRWPHAMRIVKAFVVPTLIVAMTSCACAQAASPGGQACSGGAGGGPNQNLSDKLQGSQGVLCPPNVDPGIKAPTPRTGDTPVIPPPNPGIQPK